MPDADVCRSCSRDVDFDLEPSPGAPTTCADCYHQALKEWGLW